MTQTQFSTVCEPGAVVLVSFRFSSGQSAKQRPAVILSTAPYHASRIDAIMMALSTQVQGNYYGDVVLSDWQAAGLPRPTKAKAVIQTIEQRTITKRIGTLSAADLRSVQHSIRSILHI